MSDINTKIAAVLNEIGHVVKDTDGYNYEYASLNQVLDVVKAALNNHELSLSQPIVNVNGTNLLSTTVHDRGTGEHEALSSIALPHYDDMQKLGSAITYARRYALLAAFSMEVHDDDGEAASGNRNAQPTSEDSPAYRVKAALASVDDEQREHYKGLLHNEYGPWGELDAEGQANAADYIETMISMGGTFEEEN